MSRHTDKIEIDKLFDVILQARTIWRFVWLSFIVLLSERMKHNALIQNGAEIAKHFGKIRLIFTAFQDYLYKLA